MLTRRAALALFAAAPVLTWGCTCSGTPSWREAAEMGLSKGVAWLWRQQTAEGHFPSRIYGFLGGGESLTPFAISSLLWVPPYVFPLETERISRSVGWMLKNRNEQGALGMAQMAKDYPVYATSLMLTCLGALRPSGWDKAIAPTVAWLRSQQIGEAFGDDPGVGGFPMGDALPPAPGRPQHVDLSMTRRAMEALRRCDISPDDPTVALAKQFVLRCRTDDGGFVYSPVDDALNKGGPGRGYGSATTDGLLALAAAGVPEADPVVQGALAYLKSIHRTDQNPGVGDGPLAGFGPAMKGYYRAGAAEVFQRLGGPDGWQEALVQAIVAEQHEDGHWANDSALQKEDDPIIATGFALQALVACFTTAG